jgi:hypothetical protein
MTISVPALECGAQAKPDAKTANAIRPNFFAIVVSLPLFRGLNQSVAVKLQRLARRAKNTLPEENKCRIAMVYRRQGNVFH